MSFYFSNLILQFAEYKKNLEKLFESFSKLRFFSINQPSIVLDAILTDVHLVVRNDGFHLH